MHAKCVLWSVPLLALFLCYDVTEASQYLESESLDVPASGVAVSTDLPLTPGAHYTITATGTFVLSYNAHCDAEWAIDDDGTRIRDYICDNNSVDAGLQVDGVNVSWGPYAETHVYSRPWQGQGTLLTFHIQDCVYSDNTGALNITVTLDPGQPLPTAVIDERIICMSNISCAGECDWDRSSRTWPTMTYDFDLSPQQVSSAALLTISHARSDFGASVLLNGTNLGTLLSPSEPGISCWTELMVSRFLVTGLLETHNVLMVTAQDGMYVAYPTLTLGSALASPTVTGKALDEFNDRPVKDAEITLYAADWDVVSAASSLSGSDGRYSAPVIGAAVPAWAVATQDGYEADTVAVNSLQTDFHLHTKTLLFVHGLLSDDTTWTSKGGDFDFANSIAAMGSYYIDPDYSIPSLVQPNDWLTWLGAKGSVQKQTDILAANIRGLQSKGIQSYHVVAHSMGGLVSRNYMRIFDADAFVTLTMLGTPNHGSELANGGPGVLLAALGSPVLGIAAEGIASSPAFLDLAPGSALLAKLNYNGNRGQEKDNWRCRQHPPEIVPASQVQYNTYAGTAITSPFTVCAPSDPPRAFAATVLTTLSHCENDQIVPASSVALTGGANIGNWQDSECAVNSRHKPLVGGGDGGLSLFPACTHMTEDPMVAEAVNRVIKGEPMCGASAPGIGGVASAPAESGNLNFMSAVALEPGAADTRAAVVSVADSVEISLAWSGGNAGLSLIDPQGRSVTPDTAAVDSQIDYSYEVGLLSFMIRNPQLGEWEVVSKAEGGTRLGVRNADRDRVW